MSSSSNDDSFSFEILTSEEDQKTIDLYDEIVHLFSQISTTEGNIEEATRALATNHYEVSNRDVIVSEVRNYLAELDHLSGKYSDFRGRFSNELRVREGREDFGVSVEIYEKLLKLVVAQQEKLEERISRVRDHLRLIRGGLPVATVETFERVRYSWRHQAEDNDVCCICLLSRVRGEVVMVLPCGHRYHDDCGRRMFEGATSCAICGRNFMT